MATSDIGRSRGLAVRYAWVAPELVPGHRARVCAERSVAFQPDHYGNMLDEAAGREG
jgi:hypothetical protein